MCTREALHVVLELDMVPLTDSGQVAGWPWGSNMGRGIKRTWSITQGKN